MTYNPLLLLLFLLMPSTGIVYQKLGSAGLWAYGLYGATLSLYFSRILSRRSTFVRVPIPPPNVCFGITLAFLFAAFLLVYPWANAIEGPAGSDRDDALNLAAGELLRGHYPYERTTYLGNILAPFPGAVLLAIPFVLLGNSAYQNFFWVSIFFIALKAYTQDGRASILYLWLVLLTAPIILHEVVTGGDLLANSLYLTIVLMVYVRFFPSLNPLGRMLFSLFSGVTLSSRPIAILLAPVIFRSIATSLGLRAALVYSGISLSAYLGVTLPFWVCNPTHFSPLAVLTIKLLPFERALPSGGIIVPAAILLGSCLLTFYPTADRTLLRRAALILIVPVILAILSDSMMRHRLSFAYAGYSLLALFLGTIPHNMSQPSALQRDYSGVLK